MPRWVFTLAYLAVPVKFLFSLQHLQASNCPSSWPPIKFKVSLRTGQYLTGLINLKLYI